MDFKGRGPNDVPIDGPIGKIPDEHFQEGSQDERTESSRIKTFLGKGDKRLAAMKEEKELAMLIKIAKSRKNELTGIRWKQEGRKRRIVDKTNWVSNGCWPLNNAPTPYQQQNFEYTTLARGTNLRYDCFLPTGEVYEFLPCAPWPSDQLIGYQRYRGMHRIMAMQGRSAPAQEAFMPYKLLLYRGWDNSKPEVDDRHRFVYLAENKPGEPEVGDCFVRLEEIHKRMKGTATEYARDCEAYNKRCEVLHVFQHGGPSEMKSAMETRKKLRQEGIWTLRFHCWAVEGYRCVDSEAKLRDRLFEDVYPANDKYDHFDMFAVWAELLRKSQGDKLAAKEFFGRYWDSVIPNDWRPVFKDGFKIIVGAKYFQDRQDGRLDYENPEDREIVRGEVYRGVERAINAPRLRFKPPLTIENVVFTKDLNPNADDGASGWFEEGWRVLDGHPGGLYDIVVNLPVREFLCLEIHKKPFWEEGYGIPLQLHAVGLQGHLNKCEQTQDTRTVVNNDLINGVKNQKRNPTQDKCVADGGYSANMAMSGAYPAVYPDVAQAKKNRVAEWLHRSAFSYGGFVNDEPNNSQTANNLVLGTPATNTVMMRYEAFVKRLAFHGNGQQGDTVFVETKIKYTDLIGPLVAWVAQRQYTWLAPNLGYKYSNNVASIPHISIDRSFYPLNRESSLLFQSLLDKSLEALCWHWPCWDADRAVVDALLESTAIPGDKEEANQAELKEKLKQATDGDQEGSLNAQALDFVVQQSLA